MTDWYKIRYRLKYRREALGYSQNQLGAMIGTYQSRISEWETGKAIPSGADLIIWCQALGLDLTLVEAS